MNTKQLACLILIAIMAGVIQLGLTLRKGAAAVAEEARKEEDVEKSEISKRDAVLNGLNGLKKQSGDLLAFIAEWEPQFAVFQEQQSAETIISMKVRSDRLATLQQRYQQIPHKMNGKDVETLPNLARATLTFEDSYPKLLNWLGEMERIHPTMRVWSITLSKGSRGDDLRMELVLEVPLRRKTS
jgi:hypothetical protein